MTRLNVWNPCSRVLDDKLRESRQDAHRARLDEIHGLARQSATKYVVGSPQRGTPHTFKALPKSKSPAAKARQAEIERENLKLIKKIVELQGASRKGLFGQTKSRSSSAYCKASTLSGEAYVPHPLTDLAPGGDLGVPSASSHQLYTRHSATMTHHFEEQNDVALNFVPGKRSTASTRQRTQVQIQHENRKLLQRILTSKTTFSRSVWEADEKKRRKLLGNISRFSHLTKRQSSPTGSLGKTSPTTRPRHSLAVVEQGNPRQDFSHVIRTGSPVTHLRCRLRPQSAPAVDFSFAKEPNCVASTDIEDPAILAKMTTLSINAIATAAEVKRKSGASESRQVELP